ncbi:hypothetical protein [Myxococcus sp. AM010]|uniref:hypothetical protein n=1 Tax=Myxococcus sp. AM010 TaxID=2745138 RepID=UPI0015958EED|nr:hypothetical protein [Myxococcus sp. AM010]NVJ13650.1 hypothetical protein [Myxococcus sp. AM010]
MNRNEPTRIIQASALYDLVVTAPFATPWTAGWLLEKLHHLHVVLALPGAAPPEFGPMHLFFVSLMGTIVTVWSVLRLWKPEPSLGAADTVGRAGFSLWMAVAFASGQTGILAIMLALELTWFFVQGSAILQWWRRHHAHAPRSQTA